MNTYMLFKSWIMYVVNFHHDKSFKIPDFFQFQSPVNWFCYSELVRPLNTTMPLYILSQLHVEGLFYLIYLINVLHHASYLSIGYIVMGSWKDGDNQYIQLTKVLYCKPLTNAKHLPAFSLRLGQGSNSDLRGGRRVCYHLEGLFFPGCRFEGP